MEAELEGKKLKMEKRKKNMGEIVFPVSLFS